MSERGKGMVLCSISTVLMFCFTVTCAGKEPRSAVEYFKRGLARYDAKDLDGAIEDFTSAIAANSNIDNRAYKRVNRLKFGHAKEGHSDSQDKVLVCDKFNGAAYHNRGVVRMVKGDIDGANLDFDNAISLNQRDSGALLDRGANKYESGDFEGAIKDFNKTILLNPHDAAAYYNRGSVRKKIQDFGGAIDDFEKAIALDPNLLLAYANRGLTYVLMGKDAEAEKDFAHYLQCAGDTKYDVKRLAQQARESRLAKK